MAFPRNAAETAPPYADRHDAGRLLAGALQRYRGKPNVVVLGLPRGGIPVAYEVATSLDAPLDVFAVRKLGMPGHPELAFGAIASGGVQVLSDDVLHWYGISDAAVAGVVAHERAELERREREYRRGPMTDLRGHVAILVDDGLATGASMRAAVQAVRALGPARVVVAVPVGSPATCDEFRDIADEIVCARMPEPFSAVGQWYRDFSQTSDDEVRALLHAAAHRAAGGPA
ncbi:MAG TPA: phosphoribosyltransferase family protein [Vicinamibacterales bacterium]|nr:phosphoribosyltransferase family protein [Vicinamibacterales bacterium]